MLALSGFGAPLATLRASRSASRAMKRFDGLLVFVSVVERQSFVGAARQLGLSPAAVSRKIQELEARLDITLINRTTRRLSITDVGREVYEQAARGFAAIEDAERIAKRRHEKPSGVLRIVAPYALLHLALMPILPLFRARYPEVRLEFLVTNQPIDLVEFNCDIGVRVGAQSDSTYMIRPLFQAEYRVVAAPAFLRARKAPRRPGDLLGAPMAGFLTSAGSVATLAPAPNVWAFVKGDRREEFAFQYALAATDPIVLLDFARHGEGFAIVLETVAQRMIGSGELQIVLPDWRIDAKMELSIIYRRHATMDSKTRVFLEFMRENLRGLLEGAGDDNAFDAAI